ncbi:MAG: hypothetical protein WC873_02060 [Candidatus Gracilibacteria bacterium]
MNNIDKNLILERFVSGREAGLIERYIMDGPMAMKVEMGVSEAQWRVIFDYLVFEHNLLYKLVASNVEFFSDFYVRHGVAGLRELLDIEAGYYNQVFEAVFDFLAIAHDGLRLHILENREKYLLALKARGIHYLKKILNVDKAKYEESWLHVLEFLLSAACEAMFSEQSYEHGVRAFSMLVNGTREHRALVKHEIGMR